MALAGFTYAASLPADTSSLDIPAEAKQYIDELLSSSKALGSKSARSENWKHPSHPHPSHKPDPPKEEKSIGDCSQGNVQCCNQNIDGDEKKKLVGLLGLNDVIGTIGLNCAQVPVNIIGGAVGVNNYCKSSPVCCKNVTQNGLINLGCTALPIN